MMTEKEEKRNTEKERGEGISGNKKRVNKKGKETRELTMEGKTNKEGK